MAMTKAQMEKELARLKEENAALFAKASANNGFGTITPRIGRKTGSVCVYGLARRPITMYAAQWRRMLDEEAVKTIKTFLDTHKDKMVNSKDESWQVPPDSVDQAGVIYTKVRGSES